MLKYMYQKNKTLCKITVAVITVILMWGILMIVDALQAESRSRNTSVSVDANEYTEQFRAYDVEGLTDEEIKFLLERERELRKESN